MLQDNKLRIVLILTVQIKCYYKTNNENQIHYTGYREHMKLNLVEKHRCPI
jgi:hypothetical protein